MRYPGPHAYQEAPTTRPPERQEAKRTPAERSAVREWAPLREQMVAGVSALMRQMRALQERYEEEYQRLAAVLELLTVQSRDLERKLAELGSLASVLEGEPVAPEPTRALLTAVPGGEPEIREATALEVRCLGGFEVRYAGRAVDLGTSRNGRLLFKYLIARAPGHRAPKELLAELFWPDTPLERALSCLQSAVHQLKRAMARSAPELQTTPAIVFVDDAYGLNPRLELRSDVELFRRRLSAARAQDAHGQADVARQAYRLALEAYGGELFPEDRYEDWVIAEREALEADYLAILTRLVQLAMAEGAYAEALSYGRTLLERDATREDIHRELMRCYSRLGQRSEALRQYRRCLETLEAELNVPPEAETTALYERLSRGEPI